MPASLALKSPTSRAFAISLALHLLLFLLLVFIAARSLPPVLSVTVVVEKEETPTTEIIEKEIEEPVQNDRRRKPRRPSTAAAQKSRRGTNNPDATAGDPWRDYERNLHRRGNRGTEQAAARADGTAWGSEKFSRGDKHGTSENVEIPRGKTGSRTRWRKGAARRLVSMPAIDYPESVRKKSGQGQVELLIEVDADGRVESVEVLKSSGYTRLDLNAKNAYRSAVFSPSSSGESATGVVVVTFKMRDN